MYLLKGYTCIWYHFPSAGDKQQPQRLSKLRCNLTVADPPDCGRKRGSTSTLSPYQGSLVFDHLFGRTSRSTIRKHKRRKATDRRANRRLHPLDAF